MQRQSFTSCAVMHIQAFGQKLLVKDGEGMQVPRKLKLSGQPKFVPLLREELVKMKETMATIASKCKLNTKSIKDKYSESGGWKNKVASHCKVRYTKEHFIYLAKK